MNALVLDPLFAFRTALVTCFGRRRDALFELVDALLTADDRSSLARLSLTPVHQRRWGSVYAALRRGRVHAEVLQDLLVRHPAFDGPPTFAVDVSVWPRPEAETSPERAYQYFPAAHGQQPVVGGWAYQWIAQLSPSWDRCTARRRPTVMCTSGPGRGHSVIRRPVRPGVIGAHRGPRLHAQGSVLRVEVERLPGRQRTPAILWLWWQGPPGQEAPTVADLERCWRAYARRYDLEQTFRCLKQVLGWVMPHVRLPEQADRWTWLVVAAYTQLRLARDADADRRLPWERPLPPSRLTPGRVRRGFATLVRHLPAVAAAPNPCGRSPGRPKGRRSQPAARSPPRKKAA